MLIFQLKIFTETKNNKNVLLPILNFAMQKKEFYYVLMWPKEV